MAEKDVSNIFYDFYSCLLTWEFKKYAVDLLLVFLDLKIQILSFCFRGSNRISPQSCVQKINKWHTHLKCSTIIILLLCVYSEGKINQNKVKYYRKYKLYWYTHEKYTIVIYFLWLQFNMFLLFIKKYANKNIKYTQNNTQYWYTIRQHFLNKLKV